MASNASDWPDYRPPKPAFESPPSRTLSDESFAAFITELVLRRATAFEIVGCRGITAAGFRCLADGAWTAMSLANTNAGSVAVEALGRSRKSLYWLIATDSGLSNRTLRLLTAMEGLQNLGLSGCRIDDEALPDIVACTNLISLGLNGTDVSYKIAEHAYRLQRLTVLGIGGISLRDCPPSGIRLPSSLRVLNAPGSGVGDRHVFAFGSLPLAELFLNDNEITDAGIRALGRLPLVALDLSRCKISDGSAPILAAMPTLRRLGLSGCDISEKLIEAVAALPELELLDVRGVVGAPRSACRLSESKPSLRVIV